MIETLRVQNFKALRDVTVPLRPFTVLIGPNDSGKSSILQARNIVGHLHELATPDAFWSLLGPDPARVVYQRDPTRNISLEIAGTTDSKKHFRYELTPRIGAWFSRNDIYREAAWFEDRNILRIEWVQDKIITTTHFERESVSTGSEAIKQPYLSLERREGSFSEIRQALSSLVIRFHPDALARPCPLSDALTRMGSDGYGLAAVIDQIMTGPNRRLIAELEEQLHKLVPTLRGVSLVAAKMADGGTGKALEVILTRQRDGTDVTVPAGHTSQGTLLALGYLALVYSQTARTLLIEEPENGLHPSALGFVVDLLKKVSRGEIGPGPRQIVLTTHSPLLLNFVDPEDVLIITRTQDNVQVTRMIDTPHFAERFQDFDLGELWYNVGETDLVKQP